MSSERFVSVAVSEGVESEKKAETNGQTVACMYWQPEQKTQRKDCAVDKGEKMGVGGIWVAGSNTHCISERECG